MRLSEMQTVPAPEWAMDHPEAKAFTPPSYVALDTYLSQFEAFPTLFQWQYHTLKSGGWKLYGEPFTLPAPEQ